MKSHLLVAAAIFAASVATPIESLAAERTMHTMTIAKRIRYPIEGTLPSLAGATTWLNSQPLTPESLRGKVVRRRLLDLHLHQLAAYSNRTFAAWAEKVQGSGTGGDRRRTRPSSGSRRTSTTFARRSRCFRVEYPVAVDSDYAIWDAFGNRYWPAVYVVDANGKIRHHHFGEGEYEQHGSGHSAAAAGGRIFRQGQRCRPGRSARLRKLAADWENLRSQGKLSRSRQGGGLLRLPAAPLVGKSRNYAAPRSLRLNQWALSGDWTVSAGAVALDKANGRVVYRFHARDVHLVMGPPSRGSSVRFRVLLDGRPPGNAHGTDVDEQGYGTVTEQRLYQLIRQPEPIADRLFEIEFLDAGVEAYVFTRSDEAPTRTLDRPQSEILVNGAARRRLKGLASLQALDCLVAGAGFEPATFGL